MPSIPKNKFSPWPDDAENLDTKQIIKLYKSGFAGVVHDQKAEDDFQNCMKWPNASQAINQFNLADSGANKLSIPFISVLSLYPNAWPGPGQIVGDCHLANTKIMTDQLNQKNIEDIQIGECVISHLGVPKKVIRTIKKAYSGDIISFRAEGYPEKIEATPDHQFVVFDNIKQNESYSWKKVTDITSDDYVLIPRVNIKPKETIFDLGECPNINIHSDTISNQLNNKCKRFIKLDEKFAWLFGLFLAEGSIDIKDSKPSRITLNLGHDEQFIAEQAKQAFKDIFGLNAIITSVPSKPTVLYVRLTYRPVAWLFKKLAVGNTYSKVVPTQFFYSNRSTKLALLRGWLDGDGSLNLKQRKNSQYFNCKNIGVSVSSNLINGMFHIANSCNLRTSITKRKAYKRSKVASNLNFYSSNVLEVYPEHKLECKIRNKDFRITSLGLAAKVKDISNQYFNGDVYCLEVEDHHSFIANGYASHNCVSHSQKNSNLVTMCCDIILGKIDEKTGQTEERPNVSETAESQGVLSSEAIYWYRGYSSHGWSCPAAAKVSVDNAGCILRQNYPEINIDLTNYNNSTISKFGSRKPTEDVVKITRQHLIHQATSADTLEEVRDLSANAYGISTCGSEGYSSSRDENGVSKRSGSWAHAMACIGVDDRDVIKQKYGEALVLIINSWGNWNSGPRDILDSASLVPPDKKQEWITKGIVNPTTGNIMIPKGSFWVRWSQAKNRSFHASSGVNGWPRRRLDKAIFSPF